MIYRCGGRPGPRRLSDAEGKLSEPCRPRCRGSTTTFYTFPRDLNTASWNFTSYSVLQPPFPLPLEHSLFYLIPQDFISLLRKNLKTVLFYLIFLFIFWLTVISFRHVWNTALRLLEPLVWFMKVLSDGKSTRRYWIDDGGGPGEEPIRRAGSFGSVIQIVLEFVIVAGSWTWPSSAIVLSGLSRGATAAGDSPNFTRWPLDADLPVGNFWSLFLGLGLGKLVSPGNFADSSAVLSSSHSSIRGAIHIHASRATPTAFCRYNESGRSRKINEVETGREARRWRGWVGEIFFKFQIFFKVYVLITKLSYHFFIF